MSGKRLLELYYVFYSPPCKAVLFTAKELGIDLKIRVVDELAQETRTPEFLKMNPQHCVPTLVDHGKDLVLWESRAIQSYLVDEYAAGNSLYPREPKKRAVIDRFLYYDAGTICPLQVDSFYVVNEDGSVGDAAKRKAYDEKLHILNQMIGRQSKYLTGETKTIADLSLLATLVSADAAGVHFPSYPNIDRWYRSLRSEITYDDLNVDSITGLRGYLQSLKNK